MKPSNVLPGQVRRFKNDNYNVMYLVLTYEEDKPCLLMLLDALEDDDVGRVVAFDSDMQILWASTECEP